MSYDRLITEGFLFTQTTIAFALLTADFGDGYQAAAVVGSQEGLRGWNMKIDVLPDSSDYVPLVDEQTRAAYLWNFFVASKRAGNYPFFVEDPKDDLFYLASFKEHLLTYEILCAKLYSTGLILEQRRVRDLETPIPTYPIIDVPEWGDGEFGG